MAKLGFHAGFSTLEKEEEEAGCESQSQKSHTTARPVRCSLTRSQLRWATVAFLVFLFCDFVIAISAAQTSSEKAPSDKAPWCCWIWSVACPSRLVVVTSAYIYILAAHVAWLQTYGRDPAHLALVLARSCRAIRRQAGSRDRRFSSG